MPQDPGPLEDAPAYLIYRLARLLRFDLKNILARVGPDLSPEQYFLLYRLYRQDGRSQAELADSVLGDYPNITRLIDALEKKGYVARTPDPNDRRRYFIVLTDAGKALMADLIAHIPDERRRVFQGIAPEDLEAFQRVVATVQANLQKTTGS